MCLDNFGTRQSLAQHLGHRRLFLGTDTTTIKIYMTNVLDGKMRQEFRQENLTDLIV